MSDITDTIGEEKFSDSVFESPENSYHGSIGEPTTYRKSRPSIIREIASEIHHAFDWTGELIQEWTPFLLVASYFIFSTCFYMICPPELTKIFWFVYLLANSYIAGATVVEAFKSIGPLGDSRKTLEKVVAKNWVFPTPDSELGTLDIVIVAYLPNEQGIIMARIDYALEKIVYPHDKMRVNIVYNTPYPIEPLETEMRRLSLKHKHLRVIKVPNSTSKADNLNYFCSVGSGADADVIAIFDCDHYPHPYGPRWAMERFKADGKIDTVQGRCIIQNTTDGLLPAMVAVEFDKIYAVSHPGRASMWDFGLFCGSNGYWRATLLRDLKMDDKMLTEDIDSALRAFARGAKVVHDLNVCSYELAPKTLQAFWKQRTRWAQGWLQASWRHVPLIWKGATLKDRSVVQRAGILSLLLIREWSYYLVTQYLCLVISLVITEFPTSGEALVKLLFFEYPVAYWLFIIS